MNIQDSILAPYVSDPNDDGTYVLNLSHEDTMRLWEAVDGQTEKLALCGKNLRDIGVKSHVIRREKMDESDRRLIHEINELAWGSLDPDTHHT